MHTFIRLHQFLLSLTVFLLLSSQYLNVRADDDDSDYDDGYELQDSNEPEIENHELSHANIEKDEHLKHESQSPKETLKKVEKKLSLTSNVGTYIPLAIIAAVALNVIAISIVMVMKRRRAQVVYSKMNVAKEETAFELQSTEPKI